MSKKTKIFLPAALATLMLFFGCKKIQPEPENPKPNPPVTPTQNDSLIDPIVPTPPTDTVTNDTTGITPPPTPPVDTIPTDTTGITPPPTPPVDTIPNDTTGPTPPVPPYVPRTHVIVFDWGYNMLPDNDTVRKYANNPKYDTIILQSAPANYITCTYMPFDFHYARQILQQQLEYVRSSGKYGNGNGPIYVNKSGGAHLPNVYEFVPGEQTPGMSTEDSTYCATNGYGILRGPNKSSGIEIINHPCVPKGSIMPWGTALRGQKRR